ncbi:PREDICTED: uncharacterized protein LOC105458816 isoform X2 [Wasmannia auropunctata]|uniref:uncharacterized protein LOC105458816 isoform X2 n=1 Tax=Wasmannia auropunctata TaxID=64793 RepID=UPI0005EDB99A|nr:PREDICTED: uncharacterized protein LOC105458816 isoform X2 [Wasmannia auropunctata]
MHLVPLRALLPPHKFPIRWRINMSVFDTRYYSVTKLFASMVGIWPYQSQFRKKIIQSVSMFVMFTFVPPQAKRLYDVWGEDIDAMCMCLPPIVIILVSTAKVMTSVRFESEVKELLHQIETDWKINPTTEEYKILVNYTSKARTLCIIYSTMLCNGLMCFIMMPMISPLLDVILPHNETRERSLAYDLDYGIDVQTHWLWLWLHSSTTSTATMLNIIGADLMYVTLTVHSCCLFAIVRHKLEHVADSIRKHVMQSLEDYNYNVKCYVKYENQQLKLKEQTAAVRECVINHQRAIQLLCATVTLHLHVVFPRHIGHEPSRNKYLGSSIYFIIIITFYLLIPLIPKILDVVHPLNESRPLAFVYQAEYRVDKEKYYYPILFHSYALSVITVTILFSVDTTYIICVLHACSLFIAISQRLESITGEIDTSNDNEIIHKKTHYHLLMEKHGSAGNDYSELITCLKKHQLALEHVKILNATFTQATFILLAMNTLLLSVIGIQLINNLEHTEEVIRYIFITCGVFTHLICMCIPGQLLIDQSTEVFDKAYGSAWHTFSMKTRSLLRVLLYRSLTPCTLTAGKMFVMSMTMCSSVMQTALSYFTVFLSVR